MTVISYFGVTANSSRSVNNTVIADNDILVDEYKRRNLYVFADFSVRMDISQWAYLWIKIRHL